ncbi:ATP synthase subunit b 1 [Candidatus Magnetomoraceae bacterium gMMP-15]
MKMFGFIKKSFVIVCLSILLVYGGTAMASPTSEHGDEHAVSSSGGEHAESGEDHGTKGWVATDTYRVMNFTVLLAGLIFLLRKPVAQGLNARIKGIKDQLEDLDARKEEAEKKIVQYNERLATLDKETEKILADYVKQGEAAKQRILDEAGVQAEKLQGQARKNMTHEFSQARQALQSEIFEKAVVMAEKMIKEKITSDDQDRLVGDYLKKVVAK